MSKSSNTLKVQSGSTVYTCDLYDTTAEAKVYGASGYLPVKVGSANLYAPLYPATGWTQGFYDNYGTPVHVKNGSTEYILAQKSLIQLGITAVANQTITVTPSNNSIYSSGAWTSGNRYFPYGTTWSASISGNTGWNAGTLKNGSTNITAGTTYTLTNANVNVTATAATHKTYKITLPSTSNQTITIHYKEYNGTSWVNTTWKTTTASITLGHGSQYYLTAAGNTGWNAGAITNAGSESSPLTLTAARSVTIGAATLKTYVLTLAATSHQTIKIQYAARNADGTDGTWSSEISSGSSEKTYTLRHGSKYKVTAFSASTGWNAGTLNKTKGTEYTLTAAATISATAASLKTFTLTLAAQTNQTIKIKYRNRNTTDTGYGDWSSEITSGSSDKTYTLRYNSQVQVTSHAASTGYTKGTLKVGGSNASTGTNYTITANTTVTSTAATINSYYLRFSSYTSVKKNSSSGAAITSGSKVNYGQKIWVDDTYYNTVEKHFKLYKNSSASGSIWLEKIEPNVPFTFNMPNSQVYINNVSSSSSGDGD